MMSKSLSMHLAVTHDLEDEKFGHEARVACFRSPLLARQIMGIWLCLFLQVGSGQAEDPAWTFKVCRNAALARSPELEAELFNIQAATAEIDRQKAALMPELSGEVSSNILIGRPDSPFAVVNVPEPQNGSTSPRKWTKWTQLGLANIDLSYPIFKNGSLLQLNHPPTVAVAKAGKSQQESMLKLTRESIAYVVADAFFTAVWYQQKLDFDQQRAALSEERLRIYEGLEANDLKLLQDVQLATAELTTDRSIFYSTREKSSESSALLLRLTGTQSSVKLPMLDPTPPSISKLPTLRDLENRVAGSHPSVAVQLDAIEIAMQNYRLSRSAMFPTVSVDANYSAGSKYDFRSVPNVFFAGIKVNVPIFDFGERLAETREARDKYYASKALLRKIREDLQNAIAQTLIELQGIEDTLADLERDYVQAKNNLTLVSSQSNQGLVTRLAVLEATYNLLGIQEQLESQRLSQRLKYAYLQTATGGTWQWLR
jgi:outer membrane protein TolC